MRQFKSRRRIGTGPRVSAVVAASIMLLSASSAMSQDRGRAMLLLHAEAQRADVDAALPDLADQGCSPWRQGAVAGTQGNLDIGAPERFVLFACRAEVLDSVQHRQALAPILAADNDAIAVEGPLVFGDAGKTGPEAQGARAYVFKLSRYNNIDPDRRDSDLNRINAEAAGRQDAWRTEAMVAGLRAVGVPTPDEVVVIHYDNAAQGERFRKQNPDILKQIGAFNRKHLLDFTYISAVPDQLKVSE